MEGQTEPMLAIVLGGRETVMTVAVMVTVSRLILAQGTPAGAVFDDPIKERLLKSDVVAGLFALDPLMTENLRSLGQKFLIEG